MAGPYYVDSNIASSGDGSSWAQAFKTFAEGLAAATTADDFIYVAHNHSESLGIDTTYTLQANVRVICRNSGTDALATGALIGAQATNCSILIVGAFKSYWYGITFQTGTNTSATKFVSFGPSTSDGSSFSLESCVFNINANNNAGATLSLGPPNTATMNSFVSLRDCTVKLSNVLQTINLRGRGEAVNLTLSNDSTIPTALFSISYGNIAWEFSGCNLSRASGYLVKDAVGSGTAELRFANCGLGVAPSSAVEPQTGILNKGGTTVWFFNCSNGDTHHQFGHVDPFGSTYASATIYANDGAKFDGTNGVSWAITTTPNCSYYTPYVSPWIDRYWSGTAEITPRLECFRDGSTAIYNTAEVWPELSAQATTGSTKATIASGRAAPLASGVTTGRTSSLTHASWETGTTSDVAFKMDAGAVTPAEIGHLRMRVVVGLASVTDLYVDPTIRT